MKLMLRFRSDLRACLLLVALPALWLLPVLLVPWTGLSILPYDTLYVSDPWHASAPDQQVHNAAAGDAMLHHQAWRHLLRSYLEQGELPLWNPHLLTGTPFLAGGQAGLLYPLGLPLSWGNADFMAALYVLLHLVLAGLGMYGFGRALRLQVWPACLAGLTYALGGFTFTHAVFPTVIATAAWLPLLLAMIEIILRKQQAKGTRSFRPIPYLLTGAFALTMCILAGNPEYLAYSLLFTAAYTAMRLVSLYWALRSDESQEPGRNGAPRLPLWSAAAFQRAAKQAVWLGLILILGVSVAAVQVVPFAENFIQSDQSATLPFRKVSEFSWPKRQILTFWMPNAYGNPTHHRWLDIWNWRWEPAPYNPYGLNIRAIDWGIRAYHAGSTYVGLAAWALLLVLLWACVLPGRLDPRHRRAAFALLILGVLSLMFALGLPVYRAMYALPGWDAIQSGQNWSFIFFFCLCVLAGLGLQALAFSDSGSPHAREASEGAWRTGSHIAGWSLVGAGLGAVCLILALRFGTDWVAPFARRLMHLMPNAHTTFSSTQAFLAYEAGGLLHFGAVSIGVGLLIPSLAARRRSQVWKGVTCGLLLALTAADLYAAHGRFLPRSSVELAPAENHPAVVEFLRAETGPPHEWRAVTLTRRGNRFLEANQGFYFGWHDLRGKTFLIPRAFQEAFSQLRQYRYYGGRTDLLADRSGHLHSTYGSPAFLESPLLDLWNVRYLITPYQVRREGWRQVYSDGHSRVYENLDVMPRVFLVSAAMHGAAGAFDPRDMDFRSAVWIEGRPSGEPEPQAASSGTGRVSISSYKANEVRIEAQTADAAWLVLTDAWFPGWKAALHGPGGPEEGIEVPVLKANGAFRAVRLPAEFRGEVSFTYRPTSFRVGLFFSFLSAICGLMLLLWWAWGKYRRGDETLADAMVVAKNFVVPLNLTLITRAIDFAFAIFYVRLLGPVGTGQFSFVIALYGVFELISRFGLDTLLTREVARDKSLAHKYLTNVCVLRTVVWAATALLMFGVTYIYWQTDRITLVEVQTIAIFSIAMLFAGYADAFSAAFHAFEKMEYPASLTTVSALLRAGLGALVLLLGWGLPALAWVAVFTVIFQVVWFLAAMRRALFRWEWQWDGPLQRWMAAQSFPFMVNSLLASVLLNIDIWLLRPLAGEVATGLYSVALKYRFGITIIPSVFNFAIFPLFSRYARRTGDGLMGAYRLSIRLLTIVSIPIAFFATLWAKPLVLLVGGSEFIDVPDRLTFLNWSRPFVGGSDLALQVVIWTIVLNFINAVTQYVLISLDQQRYLTRGFFMVVIFNVVGNALLIPVAGYVGAAVVTILSELFLFVLFGLGIRKHLGQVGWLSLLWKPGLGLAVMVLIWAGLHVAGIGIWLTGAAAAAAYVATLFLTGEATQMLRRVPLRELRSFVRS